jgi:DNA polymerase III subunit delta'
MTLSPNLQTNLFGFDDIFKKMNILYELGDLPNRILISGPKGIGKSTFAHHLINWIFSKNEDLPYDNKLFKINNQNRSFKLVNNLSHPNFHLIELIDEKKKIEILQIRNMINFINKSSFNSNPRFVLIDNVEDLNKNSLNALLKVVEEPHENVFFILINDSNRKIQDTLKSRCLLFKKHFSFTEAIAITNKILDDNILDLINIEIVNYYNSPGHLLNFITFANKYELDLSSINLKDFLILLIKDNYFKKDNFIKKQIFELIELYFLHLIHLSNNKNKVFNFYSYFLRKINNAHKFNLDYETLFMEFNTEILNG